MYEIKLEKFEGPLDLLLALIESENLDITELSLAKITEQYLEHLKRVEHRDSEELSDFLVVAARLLYIKSKTLLPLNDTQDEEDGDLTEQLRLYREFVKASNEVDALIKKGNYKYTREKIQLEGNSGFYPPSAISMHHMKSVFVEVLKNLEPLIRLPETTLEKTISIADKVRELREFIQKRRKVSFGQILASALNKTEVVVSFMALLELMKEHHIRIQQGELFGEIEIKKI